MVYTDMTRQAMQIAYQAHHGQLDKAGVPYIFHPIHLAEQMGTELLCVTALLHDVVEDSDMTLEDLALQFPQEVIQPLRLLTHNKNTPYFEYIKKIKTDFIATTVKIADIEHNLVEERLTGSDGETSERFMEKRSKYFKALDYLRGWSDDLE